MALVALSSPPLMGVRPVEDLIGRKGNYSSHKEDFVSKFHKLLRAWRIETAYFSSTTQIFGNSNFLKMTKMGPIVLPLIVEELKKQPDLLVGAMAMITKEDPVSAGDKGNVSAMAGAWIEWYNRRK